MFIILDDDEMRNETREMLHSTISAGGSTSDFEGKSEILHKLSEITIARGWIGVRNLERVEIRKSLDELYKEIFVGYSKASMKYSRNRPFYARRNKDAESKKNRNAIREYIREEIFER